MMRLPEKKYFPQRWHQDIRAQGHVHAQHQCAMWRWPARHHHSNAKECWVWRYLIILCLWSPPTPWHSSSQGFCTAFLHDRNVTKKQGSISFSDFSFWVKIGSHCPTTQIRYSILCIRSTSLEAAFVAGGHMCVGGWERNFLAWAVFSHYQVDPDSRA